MLKLVFSRSIALQELNGGTYFAGFPLLSSGVAPIFEITEHQYKAILQMYRKQPTNSTEGDDEVYKDTPTVKPAEIQNMEQLGQGQFGKVFRATINYQPVAVKILNVDPSSMSSEDMRSFKREVSILRYYLLYRKNLHWDV
jgi:serine/threonine protein kinase